MSDSKKNEKFTFSCEEDDKLIEAVASHPALYDLKHELYKDQRAKDNIWVIIGNAVGRSVSDCKKRWKNMKDTHDRRQRENNRTGSEAPPLKKQKKWALQERLSFLKTSQETRRGYCNVVDETENEIQNNSGEEIDLADDGTQEEQLLTNDEEQVPRCTSSPKKSNLPSKPQLPNLKRTNFREKICSELEKRSKERDRVMSSLLQPEEEPDELDLFFKSIAKTVRSFPLHLKQRAKLETLSLISKMEMDMWSTRPGNSHTPTNFSCTPSPAQTTSSFGAASERYCEGPTYSTDPVEEFLFFNKQ